MGIEFGMRAFFGIFFSFNGNNNIDESDCVCTKSECYCENFYQNEKLVSNDELSFEENLQSKFIYLFFVRNHKFSNFFKVFFSLSLSFEMCNL